MSDWREAIPKKNMKHGTRQRAQIMIVLLLGASLHSVQASPGATVPWTTYEAENMTTTGTVLGPGYSPNTVQAESSGRRCVQLNATGQYVQFTAPAANSIIVRYSVPDTANGTGTNYTLGLYTNEVFAQKLPLTSKYSWVYGTHPYTNAPAAGLPRNFYDEVRVMNLSINAGDVVRLQKDGNDSASYYIIDLIDLETVPAPLTQPTNSLSIITYGADSTGAADSTAALQNCIDAASGKTVWMPAGNYKITAQIYLPSNTTIQGAGMWHTTLVGDPILYTNVARRIVLWADGSNIHLSDFAVMGKLNIGRISNRAMALPVIMAPTRPFRAFGLSISSQGSGLKIQRDS